MIRLILVLSLVGCQNKALEDENAKLKQRVADIERTNTLPPKASSRWSPTRYRFP